VSARLLLAFGGLAGHGLALAGWSHGGTCHGTAELAAQAYCAGFDGVTAVGAQHCAGSVVSGAPGAPIADASYVVRKVNADGTVSAVTGSASAPLVACDYVFGLEYWAPILAAAFVAGVLIKCALVVKRMFDRETY
jgi:hypothetical protein